MLENRKDERWLERERGRESISEVKNEDVLGQGE